MEQTMSIKPADQSTIGLPVRVNDDQQQGRRPARARVAADSPVLPAEPTDAAVFDETGQH
jgi:hypothetical protein